jgi:hypothetical protein
VLNEVGYRTVIAAPNTKYLEDRYARTLPFDQFYFKPHIDYRGPRMGWSFMPDQFLIDFVHRREVAPRLGQGAKREPLFVAYSLTTSHHPWAVIPPFIEDWSRIGDGSVYHQVKATELEGNRFLGGSRYKAGYQATVKYSIQAVASYLARLPADDRSLIFMLGDHQPRRPVANMKKDTWYVPIHVLSRDPEAVARFSRVGYQPGIVPPAPQGKPSGLEKFLEELFVAYRAPGGG